MAVEQETTHTFESLPQPLYRILAWSVIDWLSEFEVEATTPVPTVPHAILAAVPHSTHLDAVAIRRALDNRAGDLQMVVKGAYWNRWVYKNVLKILLPGFVAVSEGQGKNNYLKMESVFIAAQLEQRRLLLGIYPQGTRDSKQPLELGFASIAIKTQVPVVGAIITNSPQFLTSGDISIPHVLRERAARKRDRKAGKGPAPTQVTFLEPIYPPPYVQETLREDRFIVAEAYVDQVNRHPQFADKPLYTAKKRREVK